MPNIMYRNKPLFHFEFMGYETPCWVWDRTIVYGYGQTRIVGADGKKNVAIYAHVWLWTMTNGPVPNGLQLDHLCRVRRCCRPDHLEPVTSAENQRRGAKTKLNWDAVNEIRSRQKLGKEYAMQFGVTPSCISSVLKGYTWIA